MKHRALDHVSCPITRNTHDVPSNSVILTPHIVSATKIVFVFFKTTQKQSFLGKQGEKKVLQL